MELDRDKLQMVFSLEDVDLLSFYGEHDCNIKLLNEKFPKLKITARGSKLKAVGDNETLEFFAEKIKELILYSEKYGHLSTEVINQTFNYPLQKSSTKKVNSDDENIILHGNGGNVIKARTENQKVMVDRFSKCDLMFAVGPAGSGKTYTAIALAVRELKNRSVKRIILTRPAVEAGEKLGFLPGDMKEKLDPYLQPLYDALHDMMPQKKLAQYMEEGVVQIAPLAYMRGRTLDNAIVILDEAQNSTLSQLKMFLTRMGRSSKFIVTGDVTQIDLPKKSDSGLVDSINRLKEVESIAIVEMNSKDIVRHRLVKDIVAAFEKK